MTHEVLKADNQFLKSVIKCCVGVSKDGRNVQWNWKDYNRNCMQLTRSEISFSTKRRDKAFRELL